MKTRILLGMVAAALVACGEETADGGGPSEGGSGGSGGSGGDGGSGGTGGGAGGDGGGTEFPLDSLPQRPTLKDTTQAPTLASGAQVIVFLDGRLSDLNVEQANHRIERHRIMGSEVFVYDPAQPGKLAVFARPDLGAIDETEFTGPNPRERQKLWSYDLAWDPEAGFWAIHLERINDEWLLSRWNVDSFALGGTFDIDFWALREEPRGSNVLYWEDDIRALGFVNGTLWAGSAGHATSAQGGQLYRLDVTLPPSYRDLPAPNTNWYMEEPLDGPVVTLPDDHSFAGDLIEHDGKILAVARDDRVADQNYLWTYDPANGQATRLQADIALTGAGKDVQVLATVDNEVYGVDEAGRVLKLDPATGEATLHDDLGPLFTDLAGQVFIGGGTGVTWP